MAYESKPTLNVDDISQIDYQTINQVEVWLNNATFSPWHEEYNDREIWSASSKSVTLTPTDEELSCLKLSHFRVSGETTTNSPSNYTERIDFRLNQPGEFGRIVWLKSITPNGSIYLEDKNIFTPLPTRLEVEVARTQQLIDSSPDTFTEIRTATIRQIQSLVTFYASIPYVLT